MALKSTTEFQALLHVQGALYFLLVRRLCLVDEAGQRPVQTSLVPFQATGLSEEIVRESAQSGRGVMGVDELWFGEGQGDAGGASKSQIWLSSWNAV